MVKDGIQYTDEFNGYCYLARYPDVAADGKYNTPDKALDHWLTYGQAEGRIPGCEIGPVGGGGNGQPIDNTGGGTVTPTDQAAPTTNKMGLVVAILGIAVAFFGPEIKKMFTGKSARILIPLFMAIGSTSLFPAMSAAQSIEGFGSQATGGSLFPVIYHVTNLNSNGAGSLSNGIGSNRTIVFDVAGEINFRLLQSISNVTIDGSGAPAPGITLNSNNVGDVFSLDGPGCNNVIVKNIRFKNGNGDGFNIVNGANNIVFDHCSSNGNRDGNGDITSGAKNVTVQYCIFGPGAPNSTYSGDMLIAYDGTNNISVHHNVFYSITPGSVGERSPLVHSVNNQNRTDLMVDFRNNVVYKWGRNNGTGSGYGSNVSYGGTAMLINNYYYSSNFPGDAIVTDGSYGSTPPGVAYISGNVSGNGAAFPASNRGPWDIPTFASVTTQDACTAEAIVKQQAGCKPLDATDQFIISQINLLGCSAVTPVMLTYFRYNGINDKIEWQTATEQNNDRFEIEQSADGLTWETIAIVKSKAMDGNSNELLNYEYATK